MIAERPIEQYQILNGGCWSTQTENKTFRSLEKAIEYAGKHADELSALEVFIHNGGQREEIICGAELRSLITRVCHH